MAAFDFDRVDDCHVLAISGTARDQKCLAANPVLFQNSFSIIRRASRRLQSFYQSKRVYLPMLLLIQIGEKRTAMELVEKFAGTSIRPQARAEELQAIVDGCVRSAPPHLITFTYMPLQSSVFGARFRRDAFCQIFDGHLDIAVRCLSPPSDASLPGTGAGSLYFLFEQKRRNLIAEI
jgi:hypothetical protein